MTVSLKKDLKQQETLVVFLDENKKFLNKWSDPVLADYLKTPIESDFNAKFKETLLVYTNSHPLTKRVLLVGTGKKAEINLQKLRILSAAIVRALQERNLSQKISLLVPSLPKMKSTDIVEALETGKRIFEFRFEEFKTKRKEDSKKPSKAPEINYALEERAHLKPTEQAELRAKKISDGVNWGRRLITLSGRQLYPESFVSEVKEMISKSPSKSKIKLTVWTENELKKNRYGGILAVGQGSDNPSRFMILQYMNGKSKTAPVVLVGKGVTFDSGGLSLKPPQAQETMKYDMAGAASVLSAFKITTDLQLKVNLVVLVPTVENMPSGKAQRPGDIITMANGKTVEVLNTDAEGRLILADALHHATTQFKPKAVIDVATLTGACALAVADAAAGYFGNNEALKKALVKASEDSGEYLWALPDFDDFYADLMTSEVADLRNIGKKREAGASTAAIFLREFISHNAPWVHLDIAGCGWYDSGRDFISGRGPSGVPIRLLFHYVEANA